tara:strand:- start:3678 stop:4760 length:1083 start_codon:yes stop_codon:yes gene_type:complete
MWRNNSIDLFVDITTECNAGCPMCDRTDRDNSCKKQEWLPKVSWTIDQFKQVYPKSVVERLRRIDICGSWGDPPMNKDLIKIVEWIVKNNKSTFISIQTNGSLRNEEFWYDLGYTGGKQLAVHFAVEGINQEMHEKYRQKTYLKKILSNMKTLSMTPARISTQTLIWKHNENHLKEIEKLCIEHGSTSHREVYTDRRFDKNNRWIFTDPKGNLDYLEKSIPNIGENESTLENTSYGYKEKIRRQDQDNVENLWYKFIYNNKLEEKDKRKISCKWGNVNRILVNPDGYVLPCCYFAVPTYRKEKYFMQRDIMKQYFKSELNVFKRNLLDIIEDKWFQKTLPDTWKDGTYTPQCHNFCGKKI